MPSTNNNDKVIKALEQAPELMRNFGEMLKLRGINEQLHVLVVEDQPFSRKLMQEYLRQFCSVDAAENVRNGLQSYLSKAPNIAFLDIEMPDDNGHMLANIIKRIDPDAFVVMVTGNHSAEDVAAARTNNVDGFIVKPFSKQKIMTCLDKYCAMHPSFCGKGTLS